MKEVKVWPHLTIVAIVCALIAGVVAGWWMKRRNETTAAESVLTAGRIQRIDGDVAVTNTLTGTESESQWYAASQNTPFSVGDRIYTRNNAHASLALSGRNFARLYPNTSLDVLSLDRRRTQLALRDGSAMFDVGYLDPGQVFEVATPYGAVDLNQPGLYDVGIDNGNVMVSVLSGLAQVVGHGTSGQINKGEMLTLLGQTAADVVLSRIDGRNAGYLVDDYYRYQDPQYYDGRYIDYNTYLNDPYYFDPYRRNLSYQYASPYIPGLNDLDYYGNWQNVSGYGYGWTPRVDSSWAPYQQGYWINDYPYGPTWVSNEPWGYAPYHYGRWTSVDNRWYWIPDGVNTVPTYSPALVAFIPTSAQNEIGWVPLAPGDPYVARYYDESWNPYYLSRQDIIQQRVQNLGVPGAVAIMPIDDLTRDYDYQRIRRWDRGDFEGTRAVLDPLTLTPLRNAVLHSAWGRGKKDLPPGIAKKLNQTQVLVSDLPAAPPFRRDFNQRLGLATVSERVKEKKFNVKDERPDKHAARLIPEQQRDIRREERGLAIDRSVKKEMKRAEQSQRTERINPGQMRHAEGARVANPSFERKIQEVRRAQPEIRKMERSSARPEKAKDKPKFSAQPMRQSAPSVQPHAAPVQEQQQNRAKHGGGPPARVEQQQQGGAKKGGPPTSVPGGGKGKGKGKG